MAAGGLPEILLLEDANDVALFLEYAGRVIPRGSWVEEFVVAKRNAAIQQFAGGLF